MSYDMSKMMKKALVDEIFNGPVMKNNEYGDPIICRNIDITNYIINTKKYYFEVDATKGDIIIKVDDRKINYGELAINRIDITEHFVFLNPEMNNGKYF